MKNTVTEMGNKLQKINRKQMKQITKSAIWKTRAQKTPNHKSKKKKETNKIGIV